MSVRPSRILRPSLLRANQSDDGKGARREASERGQRKERCGNEISFFFFSLRRARASERVFLNQNEKSMLSSSGVYVWLRAVSTTDEKSCC